MLPPAPQGRGSQMRTTTRTAERDRIAPSYLVLAAANEGRANGYRLQLELRQQNGQLAQTTKVCVVGAPAGRRLGSGGLFLLGLKHLLESMPREESVAD